MKTFIRILLFISILGIIVILIQNNNKKNSDIKKRLNEILPKISEANKSYRELCKFDHGYFSNQLLLEWRGLYHRYYDTLETIDYKKLHLRNVESSLNSFVERIKYGNILRKRYNSKFIDFELDKHDTFFSSINNLSLDNQQRVAIITEEDNSLVIAGAGSGKTTTIIGKVKYLMHRYKIDPEKMLLLSFTNKSAKNLTNRIENEEVKAYTFHKFALNVIQEVEEKKPTIFDDNSFDEFIEKQFDIIVKDEDNHAELVIFLENYLKPFKSQFDFDTHGQYMQYLKDYNIQTYKSYVDAQGRVRTYLREIVKSYEECRIANYLLFNGIDYTYEKAFEHDVADSDHGQYKPDFYIQQNRITAYIEHFAINRESKVPRFFADRYENYEEANLAYNEKIEWARDIHKDKNTILIETYSYEMQEEILFKNLEDKLKEKGFEIRPLSESEKLDIIIKYADKEIDSLVRLIRTFIRLAKSNRIEIDDLMIKVAIRSNEYMQKRELAFLKLIQRISKKYEDHLKEINEQDFSDLINTATDQINAGKLYKQFSHIIIDEFQDISIGRYRLIESIKSQNQQCKLFCVGDDWQSIYRFTGSDISLFKSYEDYFGYTELSKIETTYRFNEPLLSLSSDFILKNPNQTYKDLRSSKTDLLTNVSIVFSEDQDDTEALLDALAQTINEVPEIEKKKIMVLGRYSFDINRIKSNGGAGLLVDSNLIYYSYPRYGAMQCLSIENLTVHKAKGLEADVVIILNCNSGKHGFPSQLSDDPILNLLLSESDKFENGEERRLFYVALTRAKERVFLITDKRYKSKFIEEIQGEVNKDTLRELCPHCKSGEVILKRTGTSRVGIDYKFYGCSNYIFGCNYSQTKMGP